MPWRSAEKGVLCLAGGRSIWALFGYWALNSSLDRNDPNFQTRGASKVLDPNGRRI